MWGPRRKELERIHKQILLCAEEDFHSLGAYIRTTGSNYVEWRSMNGHRAVENIKLWRVTLRQSKRSRICLKVSGTLAH